MSDSQTIVFPQYADAQLIDYALTDRGEEAISNY